MAFGESSPSRRSFIPGGLGIFLLVWDPMLFRRISQLLDRATHVFTVCTGLILLATTDRLDDRQMSANKRLYDDFTPKHISIPRYSCVTTMQSILVEIRRWKLAFKVRGVSKKSDLATCGPSRLKYEVFESIGAVYNIETWKVNFCALMPGSASWTPGTPLYAI